MNNIISSCSLTAMGVIPLTYLCWPASLLKKKYELPLLVCSAIIAIAGIVLFFDNPHKDRFFTLLLCCPLYAFALFKGWLWVFRKLMHRDPKQPSKRLFPYDDLVWDRLFNFCYFILALCVPMFLLSCLMPK